MKTKERLQTTLDRLPYGPEGMPEDQKVSKKLPEGVRSRELYEDIVRIAGPSFVELLLTQLTSMVDLMMVGSPWAGRRIWKWGPRHWRPWD